MHSFNPYCIDIFPSVLTALTLLVGRQEGHLASKKLDVGGDDLSGALHDLIAPVVQLSPPPPSFCASINTG